jgi:hypothetical protein
VPDFSLFLREVLIDGRMVFHGPPEPSVQDDARALNVLRSAFDDHRLTLAGSLIDFDPESALSAARFLEKAGWFLLNFAENAAQVRKALAFTGVPVNPAQHLSADLLLRHLPAILRRARALGGADPLAEVLTNVLRRWPLSGVLADLEDGPVTRLDFMGHAGLRLLYAERLASHFKPAWVPPPGEREHLELVWTDSNRDVRLLSAPASRAP